MMKFLLTLGFTLTASVSFAQTTQARPGLGQNTPTPILIPETGLTPMSEEKIDIPVPEPGRPPEFGKFKPIKIEEPELESLFGKGYVTTRVGSSSIGTDYIRYIPGGKIKTDGDPIFVVGSPGQDLLGMVETLDLRKESRLSGRALVYMTIPITQKTSTTNISDKIDQAIKSEDDPQKAGFVIQSVAANETLYSAITLVGLDGTGSIFQSYLCQAKATTELPKSVFLFDGGLSTVEALECSPPKLPEMALFKNINDTAIPYGGGETVTPPGQTNAGKVLSAPATRSFWALAARCETTPTLKWLPLPRGRLALETHSKCAAGGPISLLSVIDGDLTPEQKTVLVSTFLNGNLLK
jgi:hypothetical protein